MKPQTAAEGCSHLPERLLNINSKTELNTGHTAPALPAPRAAQLKVGLCRLQPRQNRFQPWGPANPCLWIPWLWETTEQHSSFFVLSISMPINQVLVLPSLRSFVVSWKRRMLQNAEAWKVPLFILSTLFSSHTKKKPPNKVLENTWPNSSTDWRALQLFINWTKPMKSWASFPTLLLPTLTEDDLEKPPRCQLLPLIQALAAKGTLPTRLLPWGSVGGGTQFCGARAGAVQHSISGMRQRITVGKTFLILQAALWVRVKAFHRWNLRFLFTKHLFTLCTFEWIRKWTTRLSTNAKTMLKHVSSSYNFLRLLEGGKTNPSPQICHFTGGSATSWFSPGHSSSKEASKPPALCFPRKETFLHTSAVCYTWLDFLTHPSPKNFTLFFLVTEDLLNYLLIVTEWSEPSRPFEIKTKPSVQASWKSPRQKSEPLLLSHAALK